MSQVVHTLCLRTQDAVSRSDEKGEMQFQVQSGTKFDAVKVALGSLEFPMTQWTVEEEWRRVYLSEGIRIEGGDSLQITEKMASTGSPTHRMEIHLLPTLNPIRLCEAGEQGGIDVECVHPHGLWFQDGTHTTLPWTTDVVLAASPIGTASLSSLLQRGLLRCASPTRFTILSQGAEHLKRETCNFPNAGYILCEPIPSPTILCRYLQKAIRSSLPLLSWHVEYKAKENRVHIRALSSPDQEAIVSVEGTPLSNLLGFTSFSHSGRGTSIELRSDPFSSWGFGSLPLGWYAPSNRPMCTGQPLRFLIEMENAINKLYFPLPERMSTSLATGHFLVFADPTGATHTCPVFVGRHQPDTLSSHLQSEMTRLAQEECSGCIVEVWYQDARFHFQCTKPDDSGSMVPAPFSLLFHHPMQFDPSKIGFETQPYTGSHTYSSPEQVDVPSVRGRYLSNLYRVSESTHQKKMRITPTPPPSLLCLITDYDPTQSTLTVDTYMGKLPCAHGMQEGDVVTLSGSGDEEILRPGEEEWDTVQAKGLAFSSSHKDRYGVVLPSTHGSITAKLQVKPIPHSLFSSLVGKVMKINLKTQPSNFCFGPCLLRSLSHISVGFREGATQWGEDGSVWSGKAFLPSSSLDPVPALIPPFEAPNVHSLDHPDYVLLHLLEGRNASSLRHITNTSITQPFAKLVLYPLFREERMLPRDTTLLSGESLSRFTLKFTNPDGTPYHFHGAEFSFSLNFFNVQGM